LHTQRPCQLPTGSSNYRIRSWFASLSRSILIRRTFLSNLSQQTFFIT
jgi:hypothetical protein